MPEKGKWKDGEGSTYAVKNKAVNKARVSSRVTQGQFKGVNGGGILHDSFIHQLKVRQPKSLGVTVKEECVSAQLCLTLCDLMNCSPSSFSVHGILQARIQEWVAIPSSQGSCTESVPNAS